MLWGISPIPSSEDIHDITRVRLHFTSKTHHLWIWCLRFLFSLFPGSVCCLLFSNTYLQPALAERYLVVLWRQSWPAWSQPCFRTGKTTSAWGWCQESYIEQTESCCADPVLQPVIATADRATTEGQSATTEGQSATIRQLYNSAQWLKTAVVDVRPCAACCVVRELALWVMLAQQSCKEVQTHRTHYWSLPYSIHLRVPLQNTPVFLLETYNKAFRVFIWQAA